MSWVRVLPPLPGIFNEKRLSKASFLYRFRIGATGIELEGATITYMQIGKLDFHPITERPELLCAPTRSYLLAQDTTLRDKAFVADIDPMFAGGEALCAHYEIDPAMGGNCIILEASRGENKWYVVCLVSPGSRIDLNGFVRKHVNARRISLAPKDDAVSKSEMEYGSINVVGLPSNWTILIDAKLASQPYIVMGSGLIGSKIAVPGELLQALPNSEVIDDLGSPVTRSYS